jgi:hypothetical protein
MDKQITLKHTQTRTYTPKIINRKTRKTTRNEGSPQKPTNLTPQQHDKPKTIHQKTGKEPNLNRNKPPPPKFLFIGYCRLTIVCGNSTTTSTP